MKKKVHPNTAAATATANAITRTTAATYPASSSSTETLAKAGGSGTVLTVWKKSLLMNCSGFTVFDSLGNLVYRVDNYVAGSRSEVLLMDASGNALFTVRRKRLSLGDNWLVFDGETSVSPRFSARKIVSFRNSKCLAQVSTNEGGVGGGGVRQSSPTTVYEVEGTYGQRSCVIYDRNRKVVAEIKRKEAAVGGANFGTDVFRLVVQPGMEASVAMAVVILLDQMFEASAGGTRREFDVISFININALLLETLNKW